MVIPIPKSYPVLLFPPRLRRLRMAVGHYLVNQVVDCPFLGFAVLHGPYLRFGVQGEVVGNALDALPYKGVWYRLVVDLNDEWLLMPVGEE